MAITHPTAVRDLMANAVVDSIDDGAGAGYLEFQLAGGTEVATVTFSTTAFSASSSGVATAAAITDDTNATGNASAVAKFQIFDSDAVQKGFEGNVQTSGGDINLSSLTIGAGDTVSLTSLTYTAAP